MAAKPHRIFVTGPDWFRWEKFLRKTLNRLTAKFGRLEVYLSGTRDCGPALGVDYFALKWALAKGHKVYILYYDYCGPGTFEVMLSGGLSRRPRTAVVFNDTSKECRRVSRTDKFISRIMHAHEIIRVEY